MINLYVTGFVGNLGTKILIEEKQDELISYFNEEFIINLKNELAKSLCKGGFNPSLTMPSCRGECQNCRGELCEPVKFEVADLEVIGKGGILASLWKLCDRNKWGLRYSLRNIPILQGTVEVANYFDINPYRLLTENSYIIARESVGANDNIVGANACSALTYIGEITNEKKRIRIDGESEAFLTKDYKDEIDKILPGYSKKNVKSI